ncbi:HIT family protein [Paenibacillus sp. 32352]|uniref:HIT family protein n=1 Tax=Paenibacillus sp. 32352 TaxID=1969111 RepID=UPI0009AE4DB2|nr:HIT family protein [Paenibacillus sp. 32352]
MDCLGCRIAKGTEPDVKVVYENEYLTCVLDIAPFNEGHLLILPKRHVLDVDEMDMETAHRIMEASMKLSSIIKRVFHPDGISICQNGGIFNDLRHYHMHLIPRYKDDGFSWSEPLSPHDAGDRLSETCDKIVEALIRDGSET